MIATAGQTILTCFLKRLQWKHLRVTAEALWFPEAPRLFDLHQIFGFPYGQSALVTINGNILAQDDSYYTLVVLFNFVNLHLHRTGINKAYTGTLQSGNYPVP